MAFLHGGDAFVVLPTGYGKSLCYMCLPPAFDRLLKRDFDCPDYFALIALMEDQVRLCVPRVIKSVKVGKCHDEIKRSLMVNTISSESLLTRNSGENATF